MNPPLGLKCLLTVILVVEISLQTLILPIASDLDFTLDYRDELRVELVTMFSISYSQETTDLRVLITDLTMDDTKPTTNFPEVKIISEIYHDGELRVRRNRLNLEIKGFERIPRYEYGTFTAYCLFVWQKDPNAPDDYVPKPLNDTYCLEIHLRLIDGSLNYTELNDMVFANKLRLSTEQFVSNISMTTLTSGLLPDYLRYSLDCEKHPDVHAEMHVEPPTLHLNTHAVKEEPFELEEGFVGDYQKYVDGYIVDYSLKNKFFRILKADSTHELIRGVKPTNQCVDIRTFFLIKQYKEVFIVCEGENTVEVIQIGFSVPNPASHGMDTNKNTTSQYQALLTRVDRSVYAGKFHMCKFITLRQTLFCLEGVEDPVTKQVSYVRNYKLLRLKMDPLNLLDRGSYSIEPFEVFFSEKMNKTRSEFKMRFMNYFEANRLVASVNENDGLTSLVALRCLNVIEQSCLANNTLTIRNLSSLSYRDSENNPSFCLTKSGTYSLSPDTKILSFVPRNSQSKLFSRDFSRTRGRMYSGLCYQDIGVMIYSFLESPEFKSPIATTFLVDSRIVTDMPFKEEATVVYTPVTNIDGSILIFAYHDPVLNVLSYYGKQYSTFEMKFTLSFAEPAYRLSVFGPGDWECVLFASQFSQEHGNSSKVPVVIEVRERSNYEVGLVQEAAHLGVRSHKFNTTFGLEEYLHLKAPLRNIKMKMKTENGTELLSGYISPVPRFKLKYFAEIPSDGDGCNQTLWVHNGLIVCSRGMEIDLLTRDKNDSSFNLSKTLSVRYNLKFFGKLYSNVHFQQMETLDSFYDNDNEPKYLFLYGLSTVFKYQLQWHSPKSYYRYFVMLCIDLNSEIHLETAVTVVQFDMQGLNQRFWEMIPPSQHLDRLNFELHFLRRFSKEESKFYSERVMLDFVMDANNTRF